MMRSGGRDLEGPLGMRLTGDLAQVDGWRGRRQGSLAHHRGIQRLTRFPMRLQLT